MKFRWPIWASSECDCCGHRTRGFWKPWYTPRTVTPRQEFVATLWNTQMQAAVNASTGFAAAIKRDADMSKSTDTNWTDKTITIPHIPSLKRPVS